MSEKSPISPTSRTGTAFSRTDSSPHAIPAESSDVGGLLVERLRAWKHVVSNLEAYMTQTEAVHKTLSKEYGKVLKTVDEPLREGHHFAQSVGGVASFFENIRSNTNRLSTSHTQTAAELKSAVIPILERLHKEIKDRQKHVQSESEKSAKSVLKTRNATQAHIELLGTHSAAGDSIGGVGAGSGVGRARPENDPFLLKKGVLSRLTKQVLEENAQRQDLIGVQNHTQQFETHVIRTVQEAFSAFHDVMVKQADLQKSLYGDVLEKGNAIPADYEWVNFITRNADTLIDPTSPARTVESIRYPNEEHRTTQPLTEGALSRKGKIMRSYNLAYCVVTPTGYLHEFKDHDTLNKDPNPEISLFLPDCVVSPIKDGKFQISGKDAGSALKGLSQKHDYSFKANSTAEGAKWFEAITSAAGATNKTASPISTTSAASFAASTPASPIKSPTAAEATARPPAYGHGSQESGVAPVVVAGTAAPLEKSA